jgi:hypothetical protein
LPQLRFFAAQQQRRRQCDATVHTKWIANCRQITTAASASMHVTGQRNPETKK